MFSYRFYWLDANGRIATASNFEFPNDNAALSHANSIRDGAVIEIWQGSRKLPGQSPPERAAG